MTDNKIKKRNGSAILRGVNKLAFWLEKKIKTGLIGKILSGYTKADKAMKNSFAASAIGRKSKLSEFFKKLRFLIAEQFEDSRLLLMCRKIIGFFVGCRLRFYGTFFMTFGVYLCLIYFFKHFFVANEVAELSYLIISGIFVLCSVPLLISKQNFASTLSSSKFGNFLAVDIFGISEEKMQVPNSKHSDVYNIAIFAGLVAGTISYFISPLRVLAVLAGLVVIALIVTNPEIGVVSAIALLPFFSQSNNSSFIKVIIFLYSIGFFVKLIRGKRVLNFQIIDLAILFFVLIIAISEIGNNENNAFFGLINYMIGAFVAGNLMRTKQWQKRCVFATVFSGTLISMILIFKKAVNFVGYIKISELLQNVVFFDGGEILSGYLMIALLLTFAFLFEENKRKLVKVSLVSAFMIVTAMALIDSLYSWVCIAFAAFLFFFIQTKKTLAFSLFTAVAAPCLISYTYEIFPERIKNSFEITSLGVYSRIKIWQSSMQLAASSMFTGIGNIGWETFYPIQAISGFENAANSGALWIGLVCDFGIIGLLLFFVIAFLCIQNCFEYLSASNKKGNVFITAAFAAFIGILAQSLACDFFFNEVFFFAFWSFIAIICAAIKSEREEAKKHIVIDVNVENSASVEL